MREGARGTRPGPLLQTPFVGIDISKRQLDVYVLPEKSPAWSPCGSTR